MFFYLERRGNATPEGLTDVGNYRAGIYNYSITAENGRRYSAEFTRGDTYETRYTGHKWRRVKTRKNVLFCSLEYITDAEPNNPRGDIEKVFQINNSRHPYTIAGIAAALEQISGEKYIFSGFLN